MSRTKIIETAKAELGTAEFPANSNRTKYGKWYGFDGLPWCAMFVSWVFDKAGHALGHINDDKGFRECHSGYLHWKATGETTTNPEMGDIVLFDWTGDGHCDHTGIFIDWQDDNKIKFNTIEGNTAVGNDSNGGTVMLRSRNLTSVKAFVNPTILSRGKETQLPVNAVLEKGARGAEIAEVQKKLNLLGFGITVDGIFGNETERIIKRFQTLYQMEPKGRITPSLVGYINSKLIPQAASDSKLTSGIYLKMGDSGNAVVMLQISLNKAGAKPKLKIDGMFGNVTYNAIKSFQKKNLLSVDGVAGPSTLKLLSIK